MRPDAEGTCRSDTPANYLKKQLARRPTATMPCGGAGEHRHQAAGDICGPRCPNQASTSHTSPIPECATRKKLRELVACSKSVAEVVRRLGINPVGGNQAHIGRRIAALRIDTSHFLRVPRSRPKGAMDNPLTLGSPSNGRIPGDRLHRELLRAGIAESCALCGIGTEWNGRPLRLEVDHVSGEWWDNRPGNLRLLCPNCHAVTDTYRGRNRRRRA